MLQTKGLRFWQQYQVREEFLFQPLLFQNKHNVIFLATFGAFSTGVALSWTSPALPVLAECGDNCALGVDLGKEAGSWLASILNIGCVISCLITGYFLSVIGRKWTLILMVIPFSIGWILLLITVPLGLTSPWWFYVGRLLTGRYQRDWPKTELINLYFT